MSRYHISAPSKIPLAFRNLDYMELEGVYTVIPELAREGKQGYDDRMIPGGRMDGIGYFNN